MGESPKREACDTALRAHSADLSDKYKTSGFRKLSSKVSWFFCQSKARHLFSIEPLGAIPAYTIRREKAKLQELGKKTDENAGQKW